MKKILFFIGLLALCSCSKAQLNSPSWWGGLNTSECVGHIVVSTVPVPNPFPPPEYIPVVQTVWFNCSGEYTIQPHNFTNAPTDTKDAGLTRKVDTRIFADYNLTRYNAENGIKALPYSGYNRLPVSLWLRPLGFVQNFNYYGGTYSYLVEKGVGKTNVSVNTYVNGSNSSGETTVRVYDPWVSTDTPVSAQVYPNVTNATYTQSVNVSEKTHFVFIEVTNLGYYNGTITVN